MHPSNRLVSRSASRFYQIRFCLVALHAVLIVGGIFRNGFTATEPGLLASGMMDWRVGDFDHFQVNPPLVRMWATIGLANVDIDLVDIKSPDKRYRPEWNAARTMFQAGGSRTIDWLRTARLFCLPLSLVGMLAANAWARQIGGDKAGLGVAWLWCFHPSLIGFSGLISGDAQAASAGVIAFFLFRLWLRQPSWQMTGLLGVALGITVLTKTSWLLIFVLIPMLWITVRVLEACWKSKTPNAESHSPISDSCNVTTTHQFARGIVAFIIALLVINAFYGFKGSFKRLGSYQFISRALAGSKGWSEQGFQGNRFIGTVLAEIPVPLPEPLVSGLDLQKWDFDRERWSYFRGVWQRHGWWYYYLVGWFFKTPLGLIGLSLFAMILPFRRSSARAPIADEVILLAVPAVFFAVASMETGLNRHLRYVLPALPFMLIWVSRAFVVFSPTQPVASVPVGRSRMNATMPQVVVSVCAIVFAIASLVHYPLSLSYFNPIAGGSRHAERWFNASNIDWGQDVLAIKRWQARRQDARPMFVKHHYNLVDLSAIGIHSDGVPPAIPDSNDPSNSTNELREGWYLIDRESLIDRQQAYRYLTNLDPVMILGDNFKVFFLDEATCKRLNHQWFA